MWNVWTIVVLCLCMESESVFGFAPQLQSIRLGDASSVMIPKTLSSSSSSSTAASRSFKISGGIQLYAEEGKRTKSKGVYVRPSGAIEKGSGFFVPGLEGPKVRVVVGIVLLGLTAVNHITSPTPFGNISFEEVVAILYSLLVLFQAAIEYGKEELIVEGTSRSIIIAKTTTDEELLQKWATSSSSLDDDEKSKIQWAAASYLSITPATQMMLLKKSESPGYQTVYRLGNSGNSCNSRNATDESAGIEAALKQLQQSKGGRISLPLTHPAAVALGLSAGDDDDDDDSNNNSRTRCIVLQRITDNSCWLVTSDQLLARFTQADLKWLGRLAAYVGTSS